jgi:methyltransferase of ATP-grasp peptide maturase system
MMTQTIDERLERNRTELARELFERGKIRTPQWRRVFERTPRHIFVPRFYVRDDRPDGPTVWRELSEESGRSWADAVYTNTTHVITLDPRTKRAAPGGGWHGVPTSSSTLPGVMATMLEQLDVHDGMRVLEIGTGTGYTCALLCERLGPDHVTSVDIDPGLVEQARIRLMAAGYDATVRAADGFHGYPSGAPYDRLIATCSVPRVPDSWLAQVRPGGVILTDIRGPIGGALARLTVDADGTAHGRFPPDGAYFMPLRHDATRYARPAARRSDPAATTRSTRLDPATLHDFSFAFLAQLHLPDVDTFQIVEIDNAPQLELRARDGSWARVATNAHRDSTRTVAQAGPRRLWDLVERAHQWWNDQGSPTWDRFRITVDNSKRQLVQLDSNRSLRWQLG